ncbi:WYL domain-containing protein [Magnetovibrio blakemorei]|uniref:Transcriptional regulator n=1 Tax=Magnetovibrio blakemorei TaxID=28181 RepID=A0A1E5Q3T6_9PROT|nr:WYL domain-containing protein [Magnetovibrio blakemorei]OEJ64566.1 transcriptional regulator [Magnetovibrio blakemorei]
MGDIRQNQQDSSGSPELRWGVERRLEFLEFRLFWEGRFNRKDIVEFFGVSNPQASADIHRYQDLAPNNIRYDGSQKFFVRGDDFKPILITPDANRYLAQLRSISDGVLAPRETWVAKTPAFDAVPLPRRTVDPKRLLSILEAIHTGSAIQVQYQSMTRPEPTWRWITPHALGFDGFRWHARAYCHLDKIFKDFLIPRILGTRKTKPHDIDASNDHAWQQTITFKIGPNPNLTPTQQTVVELDYGMKNGVLEIETRLAFSYYLRKRLGLDVDPSLRDASDQHIVLLNSDEIDVSQQSVLEGDSNA